MTLHDNKPSLISRADRARAAADWAEAARLYRAALDRNPSNPSIWVQYGHALKEAGDLRQSEAAYRTALLHDPASADGYLQLGHALKLQGRGGEAGAAYFRAFAIERGLSDALTELHGLGWSDSALGELRRLREPQPAEAPPVEPATREDARRLTELIDAEFGAETAARVASYLEIIRAAKKTALREPASGERQLAPLVRRMRTLAAAADTPRKIRASIIIPAFNRVAYTAAAVISVLEHGATAAYEVIVADDASTDATAAVFAGISGNVRCLTQQANQGFIRNCNLAARQARGECLVFLNNDTIVLDNWLDELLAPFARFADVGLVGAKLINTDGTLQEAGGIIWQDATGWNFGRGQDPRSPEFEYVKEVDYVSGAAIAVPKTVWDALGGFDERYTPAYFEDADLAFTLRERGLRVLYAPAAQVVHHEGVSHGTDPADSAKARYQAENRERFVEKWRAALPLQHAADGRDAFLARDRSRRRKHLLAIDHYIPQCDRDAGSRTMFAYLRMFADAGLQVSFWPDNQYRDRPNAKALQDIGIEVIYGEPPGGFAEWLDRNGAHLDYVLLSRPDISLKYVAEVTARTRARKLYYGHDLHAERLRREFAVTGRQEVLETIEFWEAAELQVWKEADIVYYPAPEEAEAVRRRLPGKTARVLAPYVYSEREIAEGRARAEKGAVGEPTILFVGGFRHRPNVDAAIWLAHEILPRLKLLVPNVSTIIAGSSPPRAVTALAGEGVLVTDHISDPVLQWLYRSATVAVAPVRFGAGVKGKVVEALRYGVPLVTTIPGVQGLPGIEEAVEIAPTAEEFAAAIAELIEDPALARQRALAGLDYLEREFGYRAAVRRIAVDILELGFLAGSPGLLRR